MDRRLWFVGLLPAAMLAPSRLALPDVPAPFFEESFDSGSENPALEGYANFRMERGSIHRNSETPNDQSRQYIRTVRADYNKVDFVYEVTYTTAPGTIVFVGIGQADPTAAYNEPSAAVNLRLHSPDVIDGAAIINITGETIGHIRTSGPHRVRVEKSGAQVTFSIDVDYDGVFEADFTKVISDLASSAPFLTTWRLFFGAGRIGTDFDDLAVYPTFGARPFRRGDSNGDGRLSIADPVHILSFMFGGGTAGCMDASDVNDDGKIDLADPIGLLGYLFLGTLRPPPPFAACGQDPTDDRLSCESADACR